VFLEVHQEPSRAKSDAQNALRLDLLPALLEKLVQIHSVRAATAARR
jgi:2-dehydro-3-deoxyphosphooctonate aldolase (KDO 8-P synthase)